MANTLPLDGIRIIELAGIGPAPFCGMMLADNGAEVIRVDRIGSPDAGVPVDNGKDVMLRSRRTITLDLKCAAAVQVLMRLSKTSDGLIEGFRPGVVERLGIGPEVLMKENPSLVYGRMTGWGQGGPYASLPGHDINYIAISGVLDAIGRKGEAPVPPLNLLGDFAAGGLLLAFGMVSALLAAKSGAGGKVVDCSMAEGAATLMAGIWSLSHNGLWNGPRGTNLLDTGAPFYNTYATADGRHVAVGAIEARFFARLCELLGLQDDPDFADQYDQTLWDAMGHKLGLKFAEMTLAQAEALLCSEETCVSPVLTMHEAPNHIQNMARETFIEVDGMIQPAPVPRYNGHERSAPHMWRENRDRDDLLAELGYSARDVAGLTEAGAFGRQPAMRASF